MTEGYASWSRDVEAMWLLGARAVKAEFPAAFHEIAVDLLSNAAACRLQLRALHEMDNLGQMVSRARRQEILDAFHERGLLRLADDEMVDLLSNPTALEAVVRELHPDSDWDAWIGKHGLGSVVKSPILRLPDLSKLGVAAAGEVPKAAAASAQGDEESEIVVPVPSGQVEWFRTTEQANPPLLSIKLSPLRLSSGPHLAVWVLGAPSDACRTWAALLPPEGEDVPDIPQGGDPAWVEGQSAELAWPQDMDTSCRALVGWRVLVLLASKAQVRVCRITLRLAEQLPADASP